MRLYGEKAAGHWPTNEILSSDNEKQEYVERTLDRPQTGEPHAQESIAFADAIVIGKPSPVAAKQSLIVMTILDALYQSAEQGREVRLHA